MTGRTAGMRTGLISVAVLLAFWLLLFATARAFSAFPGREFVQAAATAAAVLLAVHLRVRLVALFLAAMLAFNLSESVIHSIWTPAALRGAPTHLAVMAAGVLGVLLGLMVDRALRRTREAA